MHKLKVLGQRQIVDARLFTVNEVDVEINDEKRLWHNVQVKPVAFVLPLTENNEIYLIKQWRYTTDEEAIEVIAGMVDEGESELDAAKRELREEGGLIAKDWGKLFQTNMASITIINSWPYYIARGLERTAQHLDDNEEIEVIKIPLEEAVEKVVSGEIHNAKTIVGVLLLNEMVKRGKI